MNRRFHLWVRIGFKKRSIGSYEAKSSGDSPPQKPSRQTFLSQHAATECHAAVPGARNLYLSANAQRHMLAFARAYPQVDVVVVTQDARPSFRREFSGRSVRFLPLEELVNALMNP